MPDTRNDSPDPNLGRAVQRPGPNRTSPAPDEPGKPGMGQGGQPPHDGPGQRPTDVGVDRAMTRRDSRRDDDQGNR